MKNILVFAIALAPAFVFGATTDKEPFTITKISQSGNFFPPVTDPTLTTEITFLAKSNGCTTAKNFEVEVDQKKDGQFVTIKRAKADNCKRAESTVSVTVKSTDLELSSVSWDGNGQQEISNPIYFANPAVVIDETTH